MGLSSCKFADAGRGPGPGRPDDRHPAQARLRAWGASARLILALCLLWPAVTLAETLRLATFAAPLSRDGPGLLLRDIAGGDDPQIAAIVGVIGHVAPDILVLTDVDFDAGSAALGALQAALADAGLDLPHSFARLPNAGLPTGQDMNGDGMLGGPRDAMGYGRFPGQGGLAVLSRWPLDSAGVRDLTTLLWRDLPGSTLPMADGQPFPSAAAQDIWRVSSTAHWVVPVLGPDGPFDLMVWSATPPVFDGPEDANGLRARDELRLWQALMDGGLGDAPSGPFIIAGNSNLDPADGDGDRAAMADFLADPRWQDPRPASTGARIAADPGQSGDPALDTVDWTTAGNLRVTYLLPSADWRVMDAGVFWPAPDDPLASLLGADGLAAGPHRLVWADVAPARP